jgi:hypothetical protein
MSENARTERNCAERTQFGRRAEVLILSALRVLGVPSCLRDSAFCLEGRNCIVTYAIMRNEPTAPKPTLKVIAFNDLQRSQNADFESKAA